MLKREERQLESSLAKAGITIADDGAGWWVAVRKSLRIVGPHPKRSMILMAAIDKVCEQLK
jgi:hypothetical protein